MEKKAEYLQRNGKWQNLQSYKSHLDFQTIQTFIVIKTETFQFLQIVCRGKTNSKTHFSIIVIKNGIDLIALLLYWPIKFMIYVQLGRYILFFHPIQTGLLNLLLDPQCVIDVKTVHAITFIPARGHKKSTQILPVCGGLRCSHFV